MLEGEKMADRKSKELPCSPEEMRVIRDKALAAFANPVAYTWGEDIANNLDAIARQARASVSDHDAHVAAHIEAARTLKAT